MTCRAIENPVLCNPMHAYRLMLEEDEGRACEEEPPPLPRLPAKPCHRGGVRQGMFSLKADHHDGACHVGMPHKMAVMGMQSWGNIRASESDVKSVLPR